VPSFSSNVDPLNVRNNALLGLPTGLPTGLSGFNPQSNNGGFSGFFGTLIGLLLIDKLVSISGNLNSQGNSNEADQSVISQDNFVPLANDGQSNNNNGRLVIAEIDQFSANRNGFNHGAEIEEVLRSGGGDESLDGRIDVLRFDVSGSGNTSKIVDALEAIIARVRNGEQIDAVNISQQNFRMTNGTRRVRNAIETLTDLGIPVAVAAGNEGMSNRNQLSAQNAFTVESATNDRINRNSGDGNVFFNARSTSFATANLTPLLALRHSQGLSITQIMTEINQSGGTL